MNITTLSRTRSIYIRAVMIMNLEPYSLISFLGKLEQYIEDIRWCQFHRMKKMIKLEDLIM